MSAYDDLSLLEMYRMEVDSRTTAMTEGLLSLERTPPTPALLEELMRHAHSLKGAASVVDQQPAVQLAHGMEDCFTATQKGRATLPPERVDLLLRGVDLLLRMARVPEAELEAARPAQQAEVKDFLQALAEPLAAPIAPIAPVLPIAPTLPPPSAAPAAAPAPRERDLRVAADNLNRLLGLAGESLVASRWVEGFAKELHRLRRMQSSLAASVGALQQVLSELPGAERALTQMAEVQSKRNDCRAAMINRLEELESFNRRFFNLSQRLYQEVLDCRMRPFADGLHGFPRLVRDTARTLGKSARLDIAGEETPVDRDILERIEAPLGHLLRNAVDHGLEGTAARLAAGKPAEGVVRVEARHSAGMLLIEVADDGRGIDLEAIRRVVVARALAAPEIAAAFTEPELLEFLFLPGFTMKETVTEISGRGVGLDAVQAMVKEVGGLVRVSARPGAGTRFTLQLPLTLSVLNTLLVEVAGEPYAFPLARLTAALKVPRAEVESIEGRPHFRFHEGQIGLVTAHQVLGLPEPPATGEPLAVLILGEKNRLFGLVVDRLLGERELVVRPLDPRLGKIQDISAAALTTDQAPVLIIDVDDLLRSIENLVSGGRLTAVSRAGAGPAARPRRRVLVVDDSLTVRELERKLIEREGYEVETAVDGMDGWNAVRNGGYDLVVTDIDMPRLDGIELVTLIRKDPRLRELPVMIVSYKDREEDRRRGLAAGADYYLTKGSFHDETLRRALADLIGETTA